MYIIKDEKGAAMIVALLVMVVLLLLGSALWQYSTADTIHVAMDEQRMQAYYLARAGADSALQAWKESDPDDRLSGYSDIVYLDAVTGEFVLEPPLEEAGRFTVTITEESGNTEIISIGEIGGLTQQVTVTVSSSFKYGHECEPPWYNKTSGQFNSNFEEYEESGTVILEADSALKHPANYDSITFKADALFFESSLGMPLLNEIHLHAETVVFTAQIRFGIGAKAGELFLHLPEDVDKGIVFFAQVNRVGPPGNYPISYNAYYFYDTIEVHNINSANNLNNLIAAGKLELIVDPEVPSPGGHNKIIWN